MITERMLGAAKAILKEFNTTKALELLELAMNLSANRQATNDHQYAVAVENIRSKANTILERNVLKSFPQDMRSLFLNSGYASALPSNIARVLLNGMKQDKVNTISSAELSVYQSAAHVLLSQLESMVVALDKFKISGIHVPDKTISFDILIPRISFENDATRFINFSKAFVDAMALFQQASTNSRDNPTLVYTSTSDPVTGVAVVIAAATPFLIFYDKLLDVAKKHIELLKLVKNARESSLSFAPEQNLEDQVKELTKESISKAVDETLKVSVPPGTDLGTTAETRTKIMMKSSMMVSAIANGARVNVSIESEINIEKTFEDSALDYAAFKSLQDHSRILEVAVADNLKLLNSESLLMIEHDNPPG